MVICLERGANDLYMVQLMPLPPNHLLLHQNLAYPGCPGKEAAKRLSVFDGSVKVSCAIFSFIAKIDSTHSDRYYSDTIDGGRLIEACRRILLTLIMKHRTPKC